MKKNKKSDSRSAFFNLHVLIGVFCLLGVILALVALNAFFGASARAQGQQQNQTAGSLTPEEAKKLAAGIKPLVNQSTEGLVEVHHPNGSVSMNLEGRFQNVIVAKKEANGTISQSCVDNTDSAAAFFGISPQGQPSKSPTQLEDR